MPASDIQTVETAHGPFSVDMVRDKKIGTRLEGGAYHQQETVDLLRVFLTPQSVMVDVGAHIGTLAIPLSRSAARVIAFEPSPETYALLKKNVEQNNAAVDARNKGLGVSVGRASVEMKSASNAGANTLLFGEGEVEVGTLDAEVQHADLIKIDVEGAELSVLEGGKELIARAKPTILSEINLSALRAHYSSPRKIENFLINRGYDLYLPLQAKNGDQVLGRIRSLTTVAACIAPRAWLFHSGSAPFDIIASVQGRELPLPQISFGATLLRLIQNNLKEKMRRLR